MTTTGVVTIRSFREPALAAVPSDDSDNDVKEQRRE